MGAAHGDLARVFDADTGERCARATGSTRTPLAARMWFRVAGRQRRPVGRSTTVSGGRHRHSVDFWRHLSSSPPNSISLHTRSLFAWLISHQPALLFSHNKSPTSNQPAVRFSRNKPGPAISHRPNEQAADPKAVGISCRRSLQPRASCRAAGVTWEHEPLPSSREATARSVFFRFII
jgi:hypothetical protein